MTAESPEGASVSLAPWTRRVLTCLSLAIFGAIGWCNLPDEWFEDTFTCLESQATPEIAYRARLGNWAIRHMAHYAGLDGKWQMYGGQSRFNWRYIISAYYEDGERSEEIVLPLPRQSPRDSWFEKFVDFKEAKFLLNIYNNEMARETYARYLARQFPSHNGLPISRIRYTLAIQHILPPIVAVREQQLLEPNEIYDCISDFDVSMERQRETGSVLGVL